MPPVRERSINGLRALRLHLRESLFTAPADRRRRFGRGEAAALLLGLLALAILLQLFRAGPKVALDSIWAEDGPIFLQGGISDGIAATFHTYAGYLVFVPRVIGEIGALVPIRDAAAAIAISSTIVVALSGLAVWYGSAALIRNPYLRGALVALTILAPVANLESVASGAYVPWYMLFAAFWLLFWQPRTTLGAVLAGVFLLATGLSTPGVWFFAPMAILRAIAARGRRDLIILAGFGLGAMAQIPVIAVNTEPQVTPLWTSDIWTAYLQRVVDGGAFGERLGGIAWEHWGWTFLVALLACLVVGLLVGLRRGDAGVRWLALIAIPTSIVMFVFSVYQRAVGSAMTWPEGIHFGDGGRYAIVPALLLVAVALAMIDHAEWGRRTGLGLGWVGVGAVVLLFGGLATSFDVENVASRGEPPWGAALDAGGESCAAEDLTDAVIPTSPPGWGVAVPCDELPGASNAQAAR